MPSPVRETECVICTAPFKTRSLTAQTCSYPCRARFRENRTPSAGAPPRDYPAEIVQLVCDLYGSGMTVAEVQAQIPEGFKAQNIIRRYEIPTRPAVPRDQTGAANAMWRGDMAGYQALHLRVEVARGKPAHCACCDTSDPSLKYEWANLSGHYEDVNDYARLCIPCHRRLDARRRAELGHRTSPTRGGGLYV